MSCSTGSWGWVLESQSHVLHQQKACPSQLVNAEPLCRDTRDRHVHPLTVLPAEGSASATQHPHCSLCPCPGQLPRAAPCCPSPVVPDSQSCARSKGAPGGCVGAGEAQQSGSGPRGSIFHSPTALKPPHTLLSKADSVHGPTGPQSHPEKPQTWRADPSNHTDPSASPLWRTALRGEVCA